MVTVGTLGRLVVATAAAAATRLIATVSGAAAGTGASVTTFDQCANGKPDRIVVTVKAGTKRVKNVKVVVTGAGVRRTARTTGRGVAVLRVNPKKPGRITITALETNRKVCGPKRIGVVGVFLPPLTG